MPCASVMPPIVTSVLSLRPGSTMTPNAVRLVTRFGRQSSSATPPKVWAFAHVIRVCSDAQWRLLWPTVFSLSLTPLSSVREPVLFAAASPSSSAIFRRSSISIWARSSGRIRDPPTTSGLDPEAFAEAEEAPAMEAPVMASAVPVAGGPFWGENGHLFQGIGNDPRKLRGMLRRLDLPGWDDPAGVEANPGRWDAIRGAVNKDLVRGNGDGFETQWTADIKDGGSPVVMWWSEQTSKFMRQPPQGPKKRARAPDPQLANDEAVKRAAEQAPRAAAQAARAAEQAPLPSSGPSSAGVAAAGTTTASAGVAAAGTTAASAGVATNLVPTWSVAKDQVVFSASQTSRGLEQVVLRERAEDIGFSKTRDMPMLRNGDCVHVIELPGDASFVKVYPRDHAKYPERDYDPGCAGFIRRCWLARLCREQDKINPNRE